MSGLLTHSLALIPSASAQDPPKGSIVGWRDPLVGGDLSHGFVSVAAGDWHSLGLKADGSIVAWRENGARQSNVPAPNTNFIAVAGGSSNSVGLKAVRADIDLDGAVDLFDHVDMVDCMAGPRLLPPLGCNLARLNGDLAVDLADYATFQSRFAGSAP